MAVKRLIRGGIDKPEAPFTGVISAIACGGRSVESCHSAVLLETGELFTFGDGSWGQLGLGVRNTSLSLLVLYSHTFTRTPEQLSNSFLFLLWPCDYRCRLRAHLSIKRQEGNIRMAML